MVEKMSQKESIIEEIIGELLYVFYELENEKTWVDKFALQKILREQVKRLRGLYPID
jgi:hypothetical protein